ncbi:LysR family transcriptional regulator [Pseudomonas syringae pv. avii]|nr:LysR family transcriptional regulator [Pseudomonas syringae pv. avii]
MHLNGEQVRVQGRYTLAVDDGNAYIAAELAGLGILWLSDYMARPHLARGKLVPLFQDRQLDSMPMYVAFSPNRHVSVKVRVFIDWVIELMAEHAPVGERGRLDRA